MPSIIVIHDSEIYIAYFAYFFRDFVDLCKLGVFNVAKRLARFPRLASVVVKNRPENRCHVLIKEVHNIRQ